MSEDIKHECGVAAVYLLDEPYNNTTFPYEINPNLTAFIPGILLDMQTRGQLAAGLTSYNPQRPQLIDTHKDSGSVNEVFRLGHTKKSEALVNEYSGIAAIGHTRYATTGGDDSRYAQPFERHHARKWKWFSFAFNGTLSNYKILKEHLIKKLGYHFSMDTDTEIIMHTIAHGLRGDKKSDLMRVMQEASNSFDGAYCICFLDAEGRMFVARDPKGIRPMSWAAQGRFFAAASESVALTNIGFTDIQTLQPGEMAIIEKGKLRIERYAVKQKPAFCFFEWVYFSNVASEIDGKGVYNSRAASGKLLAKNEDYDFSENSVVVPVPDTAKAAADSYAYELKIPSMEGIMRNRYVGRTFIQPQDSRVKNVSSKYTPLRSVIGGKKVIVIEDSIVRSTTLKSLVRQIRKIGGALEIHVRVACPPIISPCFYGIDMSTLGELYAPQFIRGIYTGEFNKETLAKMADLLEVDSLRYLPVADLGPTIGFDNTELCLGCVNGTYPTDYGNILNQQARNLLLEGSHRDRVY